MSTAPRAGERIGAWELESELGQGAASVVWRARGAGGVLAAVKLLRPDAPGALAARLDQEVRLLDQLGEEEGFVPVLDAGESPHGSWYAMPLFPGTLRDRLRAGPLSLTEALSLARGLAAALGRAHARGVVHRDLKPENVLLAPDGRPLIADLGVAKLLDGATLGLSRTQDLRGTIGYMAPEQQRDAKRVGPPADVFALGAIIHECLSGCPAFLGASTVELLKLVDAGPPPRPLIALRPEVPRWLSLVVARALLRDPAQRWPDGAALAAALGPDEPALARVAAAVEPGPGRSRGALPFAAGLALGVAVGWGAARLSTPAPPAAASVAQPGSSGRAEPAAASAAAPVSSAGPDAIEARVSALERAGDLAGALRLLDEAIRSRPGEHQLFERRGQLRRRNGDRRGGIDDLGRVVALRPDDAAAWNRLGVMQEPLDPLAALAAYDRALALEPGNLSARINRTNLRREQGDLAGAARDLEEARRLGPGDARVHWTEGELLNASGRHREAERAAARALELDPDHAAALMLRGYLHGRAGRYPQEIADMDRVIALDPRRSGAWSNRAWARLRLGDAEGALRDYERAFELEPRPRPRWFLERARAHEALERWAAAREDYEQFVRRAEPDDPLLESARERLKALGAR